MSKNKHSVTGRVRAMRINNNVLPAYREFCKRNYEWMRYLFPIDAPDEGISDELWIRRHLREFRDEEHGQFDRSPITTWLVFIEKYVMGMVRITHISYDIDDFQDCLSSHVDFCIDGKFRGGDASAMICELAINLAFSSMEEGEEVVVVYPEDHKAMPKIMDAVFQNNKFFRGTPIKGRDDAGISVVGYRISKSGGKHNPQYRRINAEEAKGVFG